MNTNDMDWKRDNYYTTRAGEKVRLICTDAPGEYSLVFLDESGSPITTDGDGRFCGARPGAADEYDITGPWVEPMTPLECWANVYPGEEVAHWPTEKTARECANNKLALRVAVHMREVVP